MSLSPLSADEAVKQLIMSRSSAVKNVRNASKIAPRRTFVDFWGIVAAQMPNFVSVLKKQNEFGS